MRRNKVKTYKSLNQMRNHKLLITILVLVVYRALSHIPVPFIRADISNILKNNLLVTVFSAGNNFSNLTIMATGVGAYIMSSIIIDMLSSGIERLYVLKKTSGGNIVLDKYKKIVAIIFSIFMSIAFVRYFDIKYHAFSKHNMIYVYPTICILQVIGTGIVIKCSQIIDKKGIENGLSILIALNITSKIPSLIFKNIESFKQIKDVKVVLFTIAFLIVMFILIIICEKSERRIKVSISKVEIYKSEIYDNNDQYIPLKFNLGGVMPLILSSSLIAIITFGMSYLKTKNPELASFINNKNYMLVVNLLLPSLCIFMFSFLYTDLIIDPMELSELLTKKSCRIKGINLGVETTEYLKQTIKGLTLANSFYLFLVSLIPTVLLNIGKISSLGVTSLIILVSVSCQIVESLNLVKERL